MLEFKRILWPHDFSEAAFDVLPYIISLTDKYEAEVHLIHVSPDLSDYGRWWGEPAPSQVEHLHAFSLKLARRKLEEFCRLKLAACPTYHIHVLLGDPATEILKAIGDLGADLVVMATHGLREHVPMGSVTERVLKNAPVPVLIFNPVRTQK